MYRRIVVPVDGSDLAEQDIPHVEALAKALGAQVVTPPVATVAGMPVAEGVVERSECPVLLVRARES